MLEQVLRECRNWFRVGIYPGEYRVENGQLDLPFLQTGQYYRIIGSVFNDGLHRYREDRLQEEAFDGAIWALAVPKEVVELADEIAAWQQKYGSAAASPYTSESFGGYSYTKSGGANETGGAGGWQAAFRQQLNQWRRLREL